jgi:2,3-diphosphopglycerate-independent phosphoglycerate mutase
MDPVEPGYGCGSDTAHLSIFGYDPRVYYSGRGSLETMGSGLDMKIGDIGFKSNFATIKDGIVISRRADRNFEMIGPIFCEFLNQKMKEHFEIMYPKHEILFKYSTEHRCGIRIRGPNLTNTISNTDPLKDGLPLLESKSLENSVDSKFSSDMINNISKVITDELLNHEINKQRESEGKPMANAVLFRGCGVRINAPNFEEKHKLKSFMIAPTAIIKGLGMTFDMDIVVSKGGTGDYHTDLNSKRIALVDTFKNKPEYDFGFLHIKAVDDAGHDGNLDLKIKFIQKIDVMIGDILKDLEEINNGEFLIVVTGDHSTPVELGDHSYEPVPFAIWDILGKEKDKVEVFSEIEACKGDLGRFSGLQVMNIIKSFLKYSTNHFHRHEDKKLPQRKEWKSCEFLD